METYGPSSKIQGIIWITVQDWRPENDFDINVYKTYSTEKRSALSLRTVCEGSSVGSKSFYCMLTFLPNCKIWTQSIKVVQLHIKWQVCIQKPPVSQNIDIIKCDMSQGAAKTTEKSPMEQRTSWGTNSR